MSISKITRIASVDSSSYNIEAIKLYYDALIALEFKNKNIVKISGHRGGSHNIPSVIKHHQN